ncbi:helicase associated domain-containing protein [Streptomyces nogalater]
MPGEDPDAWLHFDRPTQAEEVALALSLRVLASKSAEWRRGLMTARRYHRTHHHLDIPQAYEDTTGYPLGRWLTWQCHLHTTGVLDSARAQALERLGIIWDPRQQAFERGLAYATAYVARNGHLAVPVDYLHDGFPSAAGWPPSAPAPTTSRQNAPPPSLPWTRGGTHPGRSPGSAPTTRPAGRQNRTRPPHRRGVACHPSPPCR